jgi:hypothetical protein
VKIPLKMSNSCWITNFLSFQTEFQYCAFYDRLISLCPFSKSRPIIRNLDRVFTTSQSINLRHSVSISSVVLVILKFNLCYFTRSLIKTIKQLLLKYSRLDQLIFTEDLNFIILRRLFLFCRIFRFHYFYFCGKFATIFI